METLGMHQIWMPIFQKKMWLTVGWLCQNKAALSNLEKMRKAKTRRKLHRPLVECLGNIGDWKKSNEEYEHEQLDKMLQIFYTEILTKDGLEYEPEAASI